MNRLFILVCAICAACISPSCERSASESSLSSTDSEATNEPTFITIPLTIEPEIVEFDEFIHYGVPIDVSAVSELGTPTTIVLTESNIETPVFSAEEINGETISTPQKPNKAE